ncbi:MAG: tRNA (N(6)-L-threonylcarbamoyladenosine(37)-C(2))-methylthiotransferase [Candidatus Bathyarchaeia archaeon]
MVEEEMAGMGKRVCVESFGCPTSKADGEFMAGCLSEAGYEVVNGAEEADVLIYNTCAVKSPTENRMISMLKGAPKGKRLVVAGCLPLINLERLKAEVCFDGVVGPALGREIVEVVRAVCRGEKVMLLKGDSMPSLDLPRVPVNAIVGIVPISYGCLGSCSYCCVRFARGRLRSYGVGELVERVKRDLDSGAREVWLTSQDTACYGKDIDTSLAELLRAVCKIDGEFFVRVGMMNPNQALEVLDDLIQAYKDDRVFKFLHLPVQSGDDGVLERMNRFYSVEDFGKIVRCFRREFPRVTVATDVICGFPGEGEDAFERTMELVEEVQPDIVNVSRFFPRPGTPAKGMEQLPSLVVKARSGRMAGLARRICFERNRGWLGWEGRVLVDEVGGKSGSLVGRNSAYKPVVLRTEECLLGRLVDVRIVGAHATYLEGEVRR